MVGKSSDDFWRRVSRNLELASSSDLKSKSPFRSVISGKGDPGKKRSGQVMRNVILLLLLCCSIGLAQVSSGTEQSDQEWLQPKNWETIQWQPDAATALRESQSLGKPLMVFMMVNYEGRPGADRA